MRAAVCTAALLFGKQVIRLTKGLKICSFLAMLCALTQLWGCFSEKKNTKCFGMDINNLNPLFMTAVDASNGKKVFSRDLSFISAVTDIFKNIEPTPEQKKTSQKGITFTATTMFGDFYFGECIGNRLRLNGQEYKLKKDYSEDVRLIYERLASETEHTTEVTREKILAVTPDITYAELLDSFGKTLETAVVGEQKAWLYKYKGRPFYILYKKEQEKVGISGKQLLEQIWSNFNLDRSLTPPAQTGSGRLSVYKQAYDAAIEACISSSHDAPESLLINSEALLYTDNDERRSLTGYLGKKHSFSVNDSALVKMVAENDSLDKHDIGQLIVWISHYSFIGAKRMNFNIAARLGECEALSLNMEFILSGNGWEGQIK